MHDFLLQILTIINYEGDKEDFAQEFLQIVKDKTAENLLSKVTQEKKTEIEETVKSGNAEKVKNLIDAEFSQDIYKTELQKTFAEVVGDYIKEIVDSLSDEQKKMLESYFQSTLLAH